MGLSVPRLKFCGFTREEDLDVALGLGVDAVGLNFYSKSKRFIAPDKAIRLSRMAEGRTVRVGVFVDSTPEEVQRVVQECQLDVIQLHGDESPDWLDRWHAVMGDGALPIWKSLAYRGDVDRSVWEDWVSRYDSKTISSPSGKLGAMLVDAYEPLERGGTGKLANWDLLRPRPRCFLDREGIGIPLILAGGLTSDNIARALEIVQPAGVDVASGIESSPGIKDRIRMTEFSKKVRAHYSASRSSP